jgi:hypothetical protein
MIRGSKSGAVLLRIVKIETCMSQLWTVMGRGENAAWIDRQSKNSHCDSKYPISPFSNTESFRAYWPITCTGKQSPLI